MFYAVIDSNNICHTIIETDADRSDDVNFIQIDEYSDKYLRSLWDGSKWIFADKQNDNIQESTNEEYFFSGEFINSQTGISPEEIQQVINQTFPKN